MTNILLKAESYAIAGGLFAVYNAKRCKFLAFLRVIRGQIP